MDITCSPTIISTINFPVYDDNIGNITIYDMSISICNTINDLLNYIILEINKKLDNDKVIQFSNESFIIDGKSLKAEKQHFDKMFDKIKDSIIVVNYKKNSLEPDVKLYSKSDVDNIIDTIDNADGKSNDIDNLPELIDKFLSNDAKDEITKAAKTMSNKDKKILSDLIGNVITNKNNKENPVTAQQNTKASSRFGKFGRFVGNIQKLQLADIPQLF